MPKSRRRKKERTPLRDLVRIEGQASDLSGFGVDPFKADLRTLFSMLVVTLYRSARTKLASSDKAVQGVGFLEMRLFARVCFFLGVVALDGRKELDVTASWLAFHNAASALGFSDRELQMETNRSIFESIIGIDLVACDHVDWRKDDDAVLVYDKVFAALIENDSEFAAKVSTDDWLAFVERLEKNQAPDFPGRVVRLARERLVPDDKIELAIHLLARAMTCTFGKDDQRRDAAGLFTELGGELVVIEPLPE